MALKKHNPTQFNWRELFNNANGQTVISLIVAAIICLVGCAGFLFCIVTSSSLINHTVTVIITGAGIYGVRTAAGAFKKGGQSE